MGGKGREGEGRREKREEKRREEPELPTYEQQSVPMDTINLQHKLYLISFLIISYQLLLGHHCKYIPSGITTNMSVCIPRFPES
jgi:hypothetical protein